MLDLNPYAPPNPITDSLPTELDDPSQATCWRHGCLVILRSGSSMPQRCVRTNAEATYHVALHAFEQFTWLARFATWLGRWFPALRGFATITATVQLPLCERWRYAQVGGARTGVAIGILICCVGAVPAIAAFLTHGSITEASRMFFVCVVYSAFFFMGALLTRANGVRIVKVQGGYIVLKGVDPTFLRSLPRWPGDPAMRFPSFRLW